MSELNEINKVNRSRRYAAKTMTIDAIRFWNEIVGVALLSFSVVPFPVMKISRNP
jgi:hypothetical protein